MKQQHKQFISSSLVPAAVPHVLPPHSSSSPQRLQTHLTWKRAMSRDLEQNSPYYCITTNKPTDTAGSCNSNKWQLFGNLSLSLAPRPTAAGGPHTTMLPKPNFGSNLNSFLRLLKDCSGIAYCADGEPPTTFIYHLILYGG